MGKEKYLHSTNLNTGSDFPYLAMYCKDGLSVPRTPGFHVMHWHEDLQFILATEGTVDITFLDADATLKKGEGIFLNRNVVHFVDGKMGNSYYSFLVPEDLVTFGASGAAVRCVKEITESSVVRFVHLKPAVPWQKAILTLLAELSDLKSEDAHYEYHVLVLLSRIWLMLADNIKSSGARRPSETSRRMQVFLSYIAEHFGEEMSLKDLAESASVSKSECLRCFKASLGETPYSYLITYRLEKAGEMLSATELPVADIALMCGFSHPSHFGRLFRLSTGLTPSRYRKLSRGERS